MSYYEGQLERIQKREHPISIKLYDGYGVTTNNLDLNKESIPIIIKWLKKQLK